MKVIVATIICFIFNACVDTRMKDENRVVNKVDGIEIVKLDFSKNGSWLKSLVAEDQEHFNEYDRHANPELRGMEQVIGTKDSVECLINYLGAVYDLEDSSRYEVISRFCRIQLAHSVRGNSKLILLNRKNRALRIYDLSKPEELPIEVRLNAVVFMTDQQKKGIRFRGGLPPLICIPDGACYE